MEFDAQAMCPRFNLFRGIIDTFKNSQNIKVTLRQDMTMSTEANTDISRHVTIFKVNVTECVDETDYKGGPVAAIVEQK
jgi:hypothetical protein